MTKYRRGEVVLVLFPNSDLRTVKRRPALIVQADNLGTSLSQTIIAMITSNMSRAGPPHRVTVLAHSRQAQRCGLLMDSVVMTDNLATVHLREIHGTIGQFGDIMLIEAALRATLGL